MYVRYMYVHCIAHLQAAPIVIGYAAISSIRRYDEYVMESEPRIIECTLLLVPQFVERVA